MHAVFVSVAVHDLDGAVKELREQVVPAVSGAPGFLAGYWAALPEGKGRGTLVFDSEGAAEAAAGRVRAESPAVRIENVVVGEVVASA